MCTSIVKLLKCIVYFIYPPLELCVISKRINREITNDKWDEWKESALIVDANKQYKMYKEYTRELEHLKAAIDNKAVFMMSVSTLAITILIFITGYISQYTINIYTIIAMVIAYIYALSTLIVTIHQQNTTVYSVLDVDVDYNNKYIDEEFARQYYANIKWNDKVHIKKTNYYTISMRCIMRTIIMIIITAILVGTCIAKTENYKETKRAIMVGIYNEEVAFNSSFPPKGPPCLTTKRCAKPSSSTSSTSTSRTKTKKSPTTAR